ncbi:MAG: insulinase family protein [Magnetococcales bacterium]|nr:insulinase family protein [Magnetococcales bacterium]
MPIVVVLLLLVCLSAGLPGMVAADSREAIDTTLANGLRLIALRDAKAPLVVSQLWYRVGAADETEGGSGLAHMLEHMMFKGTSTVPKGMFSRTIARHGGQENAATSHDYTVYYEKIHADHLDLVLKLEADRMQHLLFDEREFKAENSVVMEERLERTDSDPTARFIEKFQQMALWPHAYGRPVIGWKQDIANHSQQALQHWYHRYYSPDNAILLLVGEIDLSQVVARVERYFAAIPAAKVAAHPPNQRRFTLMEGAPPQGGSAVVEPQQKRLEITDATAKLPLFYAAFLAPSLVTAQTTADADLVPEALDVLSLLLGNGLSSRLYQRLVVEEKLAVSVDASYDDLAYDNDLWSVSIVPVDNQAMDRIETLLVEELQRLMEQPVGDYELRRIKNRLHANHVYRRDALSRWAWMIGHAAVNGLDWKQLAWHYGDRLEAVTAAQLQQVARRYLHPTLAIIGRLSTSS